MERRPGAEATEESETLKSLGTYRRFERNTLCRAPRQRTHSMNTDYTLYAGRRVYVIVSRQVYGGRTHKLHDTQYKQP